MDPHATLQAGGPLSADVPLYRFDEVDSTLDEAWRQAERTPQAAFLIVAGRQTAGRGRRGRGWVSERGNLYATFLLPGFTGYASLANLPLVVALGVHQALNALLPEDARTARRLRIKWPNDLLLDERKVSGIMLESRPHHGALAVAIGIGINLVTHPEDQERPATSFAAAGLPLPLDSVQHSLRDRLGAVLSQWSLPGGWETLRASWLVQASGIGDVITVRLPAETLRGRFRGIDQDGQLVLDLPDGCVRHVAAGDVFFEGTRSDAAFKFARFRAPWRGR